MALLLAVFVTWAQSAAAGEVAWLASSLPGRPVRVLATLDGVVLGADSGLYRLAGRDWSRALARGAVRDLARADGALLVATAGGLYALPDGSATARPLPLGAGARVRSLDVDRDGGVWVGTDVGLFGRARGERGFRRVPGLPAGAVEAVRCAAGEVFVAARRAIWTRRGSGGFAQRLGGLDAGWWELRAARAIEGAVLLAVPRGLWELRDGRERAHELGVGEVRGLEAGTGVAWVATRRGLFAFPLDQLERTAPAPRVRAETFDVARGPESLIVATDRGLAAVAAPEPGESAAARSAAPVRPRAAPSPAAELRGLHRAVLRYQGLDPAGMNGAAERARAAALLPEVRLSVGVDRERDREAKLDQAFTSGALRELYDRGRAHERGLELGVELVWRLDEHRTPAHAIAVSRERRELLELRDQVLERVNRLYFERLRALAQLRVLAADPAADAAAARADLQLRIHELAAGLAAWTGGRFDAFDSPPLYESAP